MAKRSAFPKRLASAGFAASFGLSLLAAAPETARADNLETLQPGILQVAIEPYMPYTALKDGKLVGLDSDILAAVASKLGLKIETSMTDFPGMLAAVQSQRADITIGALLGPTRAGRSACSPIRRTTRRPPWQYTAQLTIRTSQASKARP